MSNWKDLVGTIKESLVVDNDNITTKDGADPYIDTLPEGLTKKMVKEVEKHQADYITAATAAVTELAGDTMAKNKSIDKVVADLPFAVGRGKMDVKVERERIYKDPQTGNEIRKPNIVTAVKFAGTKVPKSIMSELKSELQKKL